MFEDYLTTKAERRTQRTQVEVADPKVAEKLAGRIDASLKSLLSDQKYAETLQIVLGPSVFGSKDSRLAACAGYLIAKLKKPDEALQFVELIKNGNLRTSLFRATMVGIARQSNGNYIKRINTRGSTTTLTQEIHKKLDDVADRIAKIQNAKDRDIAYEAFVVAGRYELNYLGVHSKLLSIAENIENVTAHDKLVAWYVISTSNLPEILNQGIASIRDSFERDLLLVDLSVKLSEPISDLHAEKSVMPNVIHLLDQSHPYDSKVIEYRDAALEQILGKLLNSGKPDYIPAYIVPLLSKIHSDETRERMVKEVLKSFKVKLQKAKKEYIQEKRDYAWSKSYRKEIEEDFKEYVKSLHTILRSIIGEGLIANKKLIEQIESEMSSGIFSRGGLAA